MGVASVKLKNVFFVKTSKDVDVCAFRSRTPWPVAISSYVKSTAPFSWFPRFEVTQNLYNTQTSSDLRYVCTSRKKLPTVDRIIKSIKVKDICGIMRNRVCCKVNFILRKESTKTLSVFALSRDFDPKFIFLFSIWALSGCQLLNNNGNRIEFIAQIQRHC